MRRPARLAPRAPARRKDPVRRRNCICARKFIQWSALFPQRVLSKRGWPRLRTPPGRGIFLGRGGTPGSAMKPGRAHFAERPQVIAQAPLAAGDSERSGASGHGEPCSHRHHRYHPKFRRFSRHSFIFLAGLREQLDNALALVAAGRSPFDAVAAARPGKEQIADRAPMERGVGDLLQCLARLVQPIIGRRSIRQRHAPCERAKTRGCPADCPARGTSGAGLRARSPP